ncbi:FAD dependent oxidoreductase [Coraliomargarita akajimensis DSM 45221]|uniref:FAD dependent oxidoreductase n=1 Tax=Coraliomargarita akajimensis (strain DSM 45221 / IAM 15411 / JCM 23193 / KCTC 12865 / 04OKA010-24) TaxID=583355 RepID=D5EPT3_CORAD|nr:FAD dependent oxidoreductase [Coraliomargarita akajimensis DSM 45221]
MLDLVKVTFDKWCVEYEVVIVGAGPAGIGCGLALRRAGAERVLVLEANRVGASFRCWPEQMRLITPSFHANPFFQTDLNAVTPDTSPADFCQKEHLSGNEYADYLTALVRHFELNVQAQSAVVQLVPEADGFTVHTQSGAYRARTVIWAGGEFAHPKLAGFSGAEHCAHSSVFRNWEDFQGEEALIIGGYESGIDAAYHLVALGKRVVLLSHDEPWKADHSDPSEALSPYTRERLLKIFETWPERLTLHANAEVVAVSRMSERYVVETADGRIFDSKYRPIAATGFHSALMPIKDLFDWKGSIPVFTDEDESTLHSGLYYSGPSLVQHDSKFCFIYKFRARFGVIARSIVQRLGYPEPDLENDRRRGFLVDDLKCCTSCDCAIESEASR